MAVERPSLSRPTKVEIVGERRRQRIQKKPRPPITGSLDPINIKVYYMKSLKADLIKESIEQLAEYLSLLTLWIRLAILIELVLMGMHEELRQKPIILQAILYIRAERPRSHLQLG